MISGFFGEVQVQRALLGSEYIFGPVLVCTRQFPELSPGKRRGGSN